MKSYVGKLVQFNKLNINYQFGIFQVMLLDFMGTSKYTWIYKFKLVDYVGDIEVLPTEQINIKNCILVETETFDDSLEIITLTKRI